MEIRERIEGNTFGPLKPIAEQPMTPREMALFAALADLEAQREQDKMDNLLAIAELVATIEGGK
ncbi:hypothetical protein ACFSY7_02955 [Kurthia populi]|uniref:Uncharacterized protein n=1 Tax=Kurthia populi TaxID=1562132 RepID=A0ABW5XWU8_9BACL